MERSLVTGLTGRPFEPNRTVADFTAFETVTFMIDDVAILTYQIKSYQFIPKTPPDRRRNDVERRHRFLTMFR